MTARKTRLFLTLVPALVLAAAGLSLAALAGAEDQPTVRQAGYVNSCDELGQAEDTKITEAPNKRTTKRKARFEFVGFFCVTGQVDDQSNYEFECKLDQASFKSCQSPQKYGGLKKGKHKFKVFAHFSGSDGDPTPAGHRWKILD